MPGRSFARGRGAGPTAGPTWRSGGSSGGLGFEPGTSGSGGDALARSGSSSGWTEILDAVNPPATTTDATTTGSNGDRPPPPLTGRPPARTDSWESLLAPFRGHRGHPGGGGALRRSRANSFNSGSDWDGSHLGTRDPSGIAFKAVVDSAMHFDFTDMAMVAPLTTTMLGWVGRGGREVHDVSSACVLRFLRSFNHAREPDATAPDARDLERLRAGLLSRTPVSEVLPAREWGFAGGHAFGGHGRVVPARERKTPSAGGDSPGGDSPDRHPNPAEPVGGAPPSGSGPRKGPLSPLRNKLKMPPLPIPDRLRRIRLPPRPPRSGGGAPSRRRRRPRCPPRGAREAREAPAAVPPQLRRDARAGELDGAGVHSVRLGRRDAPTTDGGYASGDDEPKTPRGWTRTNDDDDGGGPGERRIVRRVRDADGGERRVFERGARGESSPGFVSAESSPAQATAATIGGDASIERPPRRSPRGFGSSSHRSRRRRRRSIPGPRRPGEGPGRIRKGSGAVDGARPLASSSSIDRRIRWRSSPAACAGSNRTSGRSPRIGSGRGPSGARCAGCFTRLRIGAFDCSRAISSPCFPASTRRPSGARRWRS